MAEKNFNFYYVYNNYFNTLLQLNTKKLNFIFNKFVMFILVKNILVKKFYFKPLLRFINKKHFLNKFVSHKIYKQRPYKMVLTNLICIF